ncbi:MAG: mechanosensitive ion channel [Prevotella sp.]|nr:mechanosensitive ion channel [Prevotella sp.]
MARKIALYIKRTLLIILLMGMVMPSYAVLKEKDLEQTLVILREDITAYYQELLNEAEGHKDYRQQVIRELVEISKRSNQNALMLYSQKQGYVFDLTYACNEVTKLYKDYNRRIQPFKNSIENIDAEIARYDSLRNSLNKIPVRNMSEKAKIDRNVCLTLAVCIDLMLRENRESMNDYIKIYNTTEERLKQLNDFANIRYNEIQNNIFINGGENYLSILSNFNMQLSKTKESVIEKYEPHREVESQWDSRMIIGLFVTMGIFALASMAISFFGAKVLTRKFKSASFIAKRTVIIMTATVLIFAVALQLIRISWDQNFFIMASSLLTQYAWLLGVILVSLLLRVDASQLISALRIYAPLMVIGFIVIAFRIILIPNELVNLILPPILLVCAIWQWWVIHRYNHNIPHSDMFYTYISMVVFIVSVVCSWIGYTLLSVQLLIWWIMQLTCILTITCLRSWIKQYGKRKDMSGKPITETWFYDLLYSVLLPSLGVMSVLLAIYWAASVFNLTELTWRIFTYKFINSTTITISVLNIALVIILWMLFSYFNRTAKALLKHNFMLKDPTTAESRFVMGKNVLQLLIWGVWLIISLAICHVNNTWLVVVSGGLSTGVGFASKDILENIYYGISLMAGRIKVGDWIICDGIRGKVNSISYTSTMVESIDGSVIAFQNSQLFTKNYKNMTKNHGYELHMLDVGVAYGTDIDKTRKLLVDAVSRLDFIDPEHDVRVVLREFGDSSVNLQVLVWVPVLTQYVNDCEVLECVYHTLNENNISIPFPQRDLHIIRDNAAL